MSRLKTYFSYPKFANERQRILFLSGKYYLQQETIECLKQSGHEVAVLPVAEDPKTMLDLLLKLSVQFKPDAIWSMNHLGFDSDGQIAHILSELNLPVIIWYLDDYRFIIPGGSALVQPNVFLFTFEKEDVSNLKALGFTHVAYMPTASVLDPHKTYGDGQYAYLRKAVSFVGSTFQDTVRRWRRDSYAEIFDRFKPGMGKRFFLQELGKQQQSLFKSEETFNHYAGFAAARATQEYRQRVLNSLEEFELHVFGDHHWHHLLSSFSWHKPVHSIKEAPYVYANSAINLNISSLQLRTAVNLRLFDVPMSGGFLLTDWRESLSELFAEDELAVYHSTEELKDLITYYLLHKEKREVVCRKARQRIVSEHLIKHRLTGMLRQAQNVFA